MTGNSPQGAGTEARAVLWDVDGTLIDSAEYHWLTWQEALTREGFALTRERFDASFGQRNDEILRAYFGHDFPVGEIERIGGVKETLYRELVRGRGIEPLPGVRRWLEQLKADGWRQAIASSAPALNIEAIVGALGIASCFEAVASAEDVERGKPDPQIFLAAASKVRVAPARCVVVEDAPAGIEGARRAGMRSIGVLSTHATLDADLVVSTLDELSAQAFDELLGSGR
jgi:HAD superfamily hydrolase (TIGR01509 family)